MAKTARQRTGDEIKYFGRATCGAVFQHRPEAIIRAWITKEAMTGLGVLMAFLAKNRLAYHVVTQEELKVITQSVHHEGVALLVKRKADLGREAVLKKLRTLTSPHCLVYSDGVGNPHNIGSILRVLAHFNVPYLFGESESLPRLSPSAARVSKGGCEVVDLVEVARGVAMLRELAELGYRIVSTSSHSKKSSTPVHRYEWRDKTVLILGNETRGVSPAIERLASDHVYLKGSQQVESLNVSVASGILLQEFYRSHI